MIGFASARTFIGSENRSTQQARLRSLDRLNILKADNCRTHLKESGWNMRLPFISHR